MNRPAPLWAVRIALIVIVGVCAFAWAQYSHNKAFGAVLAWVIVTVIVIIFPSRKSVYCTICDQWIEDSQVQSHLEKHQEVKARAHWRIVVKEREIVIVKRSRFAYYLRYTVGVLMIAVISFSLLHATLYLPLGKWFEIYGYGLIIPMVVVFIGIMTSVTRFVIQRIVYD